MVESSDFILFSIQFFSIERFLWTSEKQSWRHGKNSQRERQTWFVDSTKFYFINDAASNSFLIFLFFRLFRSINWQANALLHQIVGCNFILYRAIASIR